VSASESSTVKLSPWPHRLALVLVGVTFPLIWIGGLVTTYDAGMAVPDWPTTYGYNLWLYPWQTWIAGPWDLFIEHGHRLWATLAGLVTIVLVLAEWRCDERRWARWLSLGALGFIIGQGILGGMRVRMDDVLFARIHGCVGPAFFALTVALAVVTSPWWRQAGYQRELPHGAALGRLALATVALAYLQLVLGSALRHMPVSATPSDFRAAALFHVLVAVALFAQIVWLTAAVLRTAGAERKLVRPAVALSLLVLVQIGLGLGTWVVKYGWPIWLGGGEHLAAFVVQAEGWWQAHITTAHVATGSLILAVSLVLALRSLRLMRRVPIGLPRTRALGVAV
jgi:cytochrome c oxidase assembly protein subunit 15